MKSYCFVLPRAGEENIGGAEFLSAMLAKKLHERGDQVEILTTCARDNRTWDNFFEPGEYKEFGLKVRRFKVDQRNLDIWVPLQIKLHHGEKLTVEEQLLWMQHSVNSSDLYKILESEKSRFDAIFFAPYLFGTTFHGSLLCSEKAVLIPCLHDESYAYTDVVAHMFKKAAGCLFNAKAEKTLAHRLYGAVKGGVVGMGFIIEDHQNVSLTDNDLPEQLKNSKYILYLGRKETGKNADLLVKLFYKAKDAQKLPGIKLVIAGGGSFCDLHINREDPDVVDLSHMSEEQKKLLIKNASFLCQPSTNESFSIVLMEAWMQKTPVLVNAFCEVTKEHVQQANAGLYFADYNDFLACSELLCSSEKISDELGRNGFKYVNDYYNWQAILDKFDLSMESIFLSAHENSPRQH